jgi:hypothetical protein
METRSASKPNTNVKQTSRTEVLWQCHHLNHAESCQAPTHFWF